MLEFGLTEFPDTPPHALARNITSVRPVRPGDRPRASGDLSTTLAIADLDHWAPTDPGFEELVSRTAEAGVAALAVVSTAGRVPAGLADALRHLRVPLLTLPTTTSWADLADAVTRECVIDLRHGAEWRDWLLGQARPAPDVRRSGRIVRWLATETGGRVVLIGRDGAVVAMAPQRSAGKLAPVADKIQEIAAGRIESAALESDGAEVRLVAVGSTRPRAVLAVVREPPFDRHLLTQVTNRTADLLSLHLAVEDANAAIQNQQSAERELRVAILELLMTGEVLKARRTAAPVYPGLLDAAAARVYILEAPPSERDRLYDECRRAVDRLSLVVQCPIYEEHLVVVAPQPCTVTDTDDEMDTALRRLVALRPDRYLGASGLRLIAETDQSHRHALRALARARIDRTRTAYYSSQGRLPELLNRLYPGWATAVLHPLLRQDQADRDMLLQTLTLTLQSSVRAAAELTGVHRNTVANRVRAAATILGVDLEALRDRAVVAAALEALFLDEYVDEEMHAGPADLQDYLAHPEAQAWGQDFLQVLTEELVDTLKAWVLADGDTARMAGALGIHAQTVRKRLRIASRFLQRDLLGQSADAYDVVLAIAGEFNIPLPLSR
ncbi:PucR family transcriptional regulator [Kitasatospora xanthocidica]|uniref:PucR family transcriptional regulator n=1 Tax=Kitasatospora xanthocidica TaxID=83382 RepID=A0A373A2K5_9ACTN|nr:PucR family transcriptional regulator [Kitasatospora xanthocidica]